MGDKWMKRMEQGWKALHLDKIIIDNNTFINNVDIEKIKKYTNEGFHTNGYVSNKEKELRKYINTIYNGEICNNVTNIVKNNYNRYYELDIYIPEKHIAFDFNGDYWHSIKFKDKFYHQRKLKCCYEQNIQMIYIYEYDWDNKNEYIKQQIYNILNNKPCLENNWINVHDYNKYTLSEPIEKQYGKFIVFNEGKFIKNNI